MKRLWILPTLFCLLACGGCVTKDFEVVEALSVGIGQAEAEKIVASFGFAKEESLVRPESGWPESDKTFANLTGRAKRIEEELETIVSKADYYPVGHGLFGFGQLFLFFDSEGKLLYHYRRQIN